MYTSTFMPTLIANYVFNCKDYNGKFHFCKYSIHLTIPQCNYFALAFILPPEYTQGY